MDLLQEMKRIAAEVVGVEQSLVVGDARWIDLGADSFDIVMIELDLEDLLGAHDLFEARDLPTTVGETVALLETVLGARN